MDVFCAPFVHWPTHWAHRLGAVDTQDHYQMKPHTPGGDGASDGVLVSCCILCVAKDTSNLSLPAPPLPSAPPLSSVSPSQTEQIKSPQEETLEGDREPSAIVIVTMKGLTAPTHVG